MALRLPIAREGLPYIAVAAIPPLLCAALGWNVAALVLALPALFFAFFFRDPERRVVQTDAALVSPADGRVVHVGPEADGVQRVSIFLSPLNVHINRSPMNCRVENLSSKLGLYLPAYDPRAAIDNTHIELVLANESQRIVLRQVAGIAARRVVSWVRPGDRLRLGERFGIMKFGSRIDLELPPELSVVVREGDRVRGGESILALVPPTDRNPGEAR